jgi:hypothetical protein
MTDVDLIARLHDAADKERAEARADRYELALRRVESELSGGHGTKDRLRMIDRALDVARVALNPEPKP